MSDKPQYNAQGGLPEGGKARRVYLQMRWTATA